jgi:Protein of unknown function (DUF2867)
MRVPNSAHESRPWRVHEIVPDFTLEDVWALPVEGAAEDFEVLLELLTEADPAQAESGPARFLWQLRDRLGRWLDLGRISSPSEGDGSGRLAVPGTTEASLAGRLPEDLSETANGIEFLHLPFEPLFRTEDEFAAEISNRTVHGVMHLAWVEKDDDRFQGQMAVYVKPRGLFGKGYMALIKPFRYLIVYPALMRQTERTWSAAAT